MPWLFSEEKVFGFFYIFYQYAAKSRQIVRMNCMLFDNLFFQVKHIFTQLAREAQMVYLNSM